jgi:RNA polymerase sigma factor (sigma-70 family)
MPGKKPKERNIYIIHLRSGKNVVVNRNIYICWYYYKGKDRVPKTKAGERRTISYEVYMDAVKATETGEGDAVYEQLAMEEQLRTLYAGINKLSEQEKSAIKSVFFEGENLATYAQKNKVSRYRAEKELHTALEKLRDWMKDWK